MRVYLLSILFCIGFVLTAVAQNHDLRIGNKLYEQKKYKEATQAYMDAIKKNPNNATGLFNLGNALYQQKQYDATRKALEAAAKVSKDKGGRSAADYNTGNTYMQERKWEDAISAYKQALRNNPQDADAKYNLSYAEQMLKKQQQNSGGKNNKQDKNQQNNQDKNNQQQNKDGKQKEDQNKGGDKDKKDQQDKGDQNKDQNKQDDKDQQQQQPQSQPSKLSEKQADQLLNALQQEEKKLQDKMQKAKGVPVKVEKDW